MQCINCGAGTRVIDSRSLRNGTIIRRRRECRKCLRRFTTYEFTDVLIAKNGDQIAEEIIRK